MLLYVASMCIALPLALLPLWMADACNFGDRCRRQAAALDVAQGVARTLLQVFPFCELTVASDVDHDDPTPRLWVCNHTSMLDTFILLAADRQLRGPHKRPIKTVFVSNAKISKGRNNTFSRRASRSTTGFVSLQWKGLESNPVVNLLFRLTGFIPVEMSDNGSGNQNEYNTASFKTLLRAVKQAMLVDGFDILLFPEGQLNPTPENGLLPWIYSGANTLSRSARRPIQLIALYGCQNLWRATDDDTGLRVVDTHVMVRGYAPPRTFDSDEEFLATIRAVLGHYGATGRDAPDVEAWLNGTAWQQQQQMGSVAENNDGEDIESPAHVTSSSDDIEQAIAQVLERERNDHDLLLPTAPQRYCKGIHSQPRRANASRQTTPDQAHHDSIREKSFKHKEN